MTIIAWDGKVVAIDQQSTSGNVRLKTSKGKRLSSGEVIAWTGEIPHGLHVMQWYENGAKSNDFPHKKDDECSGTLIVISPNGNHVKTYADLHIPIFYPYVEFMAWGSGRDFALSAMDMGANAVKAVQIAMKYDIYCGIGQDIFILNNKYPVDVTFNGESWGLAFKDLEISRISGSSKDEVLKIANDLAITHIQLLLDANKPIPTPSKIDHLFVEINL